MANQNDASSTIKRKNGLGKRELRNRKCQFTGAIAQLGERLPCTQEVGSSILPGSTITEAGSEKSGRH